MPTPGRDSGPGVKVKTEDVTKVLTEVETIRGKQSNMSTKLDIMKRWVISISNIIIIYDSRVSNSS
jgi:hypothetical protein